MKSYLYHLTKRMVMAVVLTGMLFPSFGQGFSPEVNARLQQVLQSIQSDPSFVGGISAAIDVDGLAQWEGATGYAARNIDEQNNLLPGGTELTVDHLLRTYSVTKTFTAALVLELVQEGVLRLDDPIGKYIEGMSVINPNLSSSVTIHQLLIHESGYQDWEESLPIQMAVAANPNFSWPVEQLLALTEQVTPPGTVRSYSHNNYVFLGAIIEAATGRRVEDLYRERFFTPLDLSSMYFSGRESIGDRGVLAAPHDNISPFNPIFVATGQPTFPEAYTNISRFPFTAIESLDFTGGGIISTARDLAEWGNALFGGRATSAATLEAMKNSLSSTPDPFGFQLGYGVKSTAAITGAFDVIGHNGSAPGYRSVMYYLPEQQMTIVVLTNFAGTNAHSIARALYEALPDFTCGNENRKENKIMVCYKGKTQCIDRSAAPGFMRKGAYLAGCEEPGTTSKNGLAEGQKVPGGKALLKAFPNPSSGHMELSFQVPESGPVQFRLYDLSGKLVATLFSGVVPKGVEQLVALKAGQLPAGVYINRLETATGVSEQKVVIGK